MEIVLLLFFLYGIFFLIEKVINFFKPEKSERNEFAQNYKSVVNNQNRNIEVPPIKNGYFPIIKITYSICDQINSIEESLIEVKRGRHEGYFENFLRLYFESRKILIKQAIAVKLKNNDYTFLFPDIAYVDVENKVFIDIEIDEPYEYTTGKPIHYKNNISDYNRDALLIKTGWSVIRFSEKQIASFPKECCKAISLLIAHLQDSNSGLTLLDDDATKFVDYDKIWSYEDSTNLYNSGYRDTYTKISYYDDFDLAEIL